MQDKKCTIVIPVYNGEKFIRRTLQSCLNQDHANTEIIVIEDCSTDNSLATIKEIIQEHPQIKLLVNEHNSGLSKNVNKGFHVASGDYVLSIGQDDMLEAGHLTSMLRHFDDDTAFVYCNANLIDENDNFIGIAISDTEQKRKIENAAYNIAINNIVHSTGALISKKYFDLVGGWDEQFRNYGEWLLWIKLIGAGTVKYNSDVKALYRRHETNMTNDFDENATKIKLFPFFLHCHKTALSTLDLTLNEKIHIIYIIYTIIRKRIKLSYYMLKSKFL